MPALRYRIEAKCSKSYPANDFDEEVLLVVSGLPKMGAIASTIVLPIALQVDKMNSELSPILESSRYDCAYIFGMIGKGGPWVYGWEKGSDWIKLVSGEDHA
jgi:hypothetical protein